MFDATPELAAELEAGRLAERAERARVLRAGGYAEAHVATVLAAFDARYPSWTARAAVAVVAAPARRAQRAAAVMPAMVAAVAATAALTM